MFERATPSTSQTVFIGNRPSATTATATSVFLSPRRLREPPSGSQLPWLSFRAAAATLEFDLAASGIPKRALPALPLPSRSVRPERPAAANETAGSAQSRTDAPPG